MDVLRQLMRKGTHQGDDLHEAPKGEKDCEHHLDGVVFLVANLVRIGNSNSLRDAMKLKKGELWLMSATDNEGPTTTIENLAVTGK